MEQQLVATHEAEALEQERERHSFDPLASVRMLRADIERHDRILPETRDRVLGEELSYLAEGVDRAARTSFVMQRDPDGQLVYFDRGQWRPYIGMLLTGIEVAQQEMARDPRRQFLADRAVADLTHGYAMQQLQPGEQHVWSSSYPYQEAEQFGDAFMQECGFLPDRQMGFLYRAVCIDEGQIVLESQTVDRSDDRAFAAALATVTYDELADMDTLVRAYDGTLAGIHGGYFFAGRRDSEHGENAWRIMLEQQDLIAYFMNGLEAIAESIHQSQTDEQTLQQRTKEHVYGVWAAFKRRIDAGNGTAARIIHNPAEATTAHWQSIDDEVAESYREFAAAGKLLIGCGGAMSVSTDKNGTAAEGSEAFSAIFGEGGGAESYKFDKKMYCVVCQTPPKDGAKQKWCGPCGICRGCDKRLKASNKE